MTDDDGRVREARDALEPTATGAAVPRAPAWADEVLNRLGPRSRFARDCLLAVVVALVSIALIWAVVGFLWSVEGVGLSPATTTALTLLACAQSLVLCVRRGHPVLCLLAAGLAQLSITALVPPLVTTQGLAMFVAAYTCGTLIPPHRLMRLLVPLALLHGAVGALVAGRLSGTTTLPEAVASLQPSGVQGYLVLVGGSLVSALLMYVGAALVGAYVATRRRYAELVRARAADAVRVQRERAENAVRNERTRMARELHDIAAHHLSGMVVQAGAAQRLIGRDDQAALEAVAWVRSQGKETLDSLRMVVGALRDPGEEPASTGDGLLHSGDPGSRGAPVPGADALDRLVRTERELGSEVDLVCEGEPYPLPPVADTTVYRVAQEALSNVREHAAGGGARLLLRYGDTHLVLQVDNGAGTGAADRAEKATGVPRGLGLLGMRERAQLVGGTLDAGPAEQGGWRVRLSLPVGREISAAGGRKASEGEHT